MIRNLEIFKYEQFLVPSHSHINLQSALCYFVTISSMSIANRASLVAKVWQWKMPKRTGHAIKHGPLETAQPRVNCQPPLNNQCKA